MACSDGISKGIISDCTTVGGGGIEETIYLYNRKDLVITKTGNVVSDITMAGSAVGYTAKGVKKLFDSGFDIVVAENRPDKFSHYLKIEQFEYSSTDVANIDALNDIVAIVEKKDKSANGNGVFIMLGLTHGLYKSSDTRRDNANNGSRVIELKSLAGEEEPYSAWIVFKTDMATTRALIEATLT